MEHTPIHPHSSPDSLRVYTSNNMRVLAERLAELITASPLPPLKQEVVLVQNPAIGRWLQLELARMNHISANLSISLSNAYMHSLFSQVMPLSDDEDMTPFSTWAMTWRIMDALPGLMEAPAFSELRRYLASDPEGKKGYGLCSRIAKIFDGYLLFRPQMIMQWDQGKAKNWQAILWREISKGFPNQHRPAMQQRFYQALDGHGEIPPGFPHRISLFGVWALPPFHLDLFSRLGQSVPVHLFHVNPCRQYWAEALADRQISRIASRYPNTPREDLYLEKGNPLLSSMGGIGKDFMKFLLDVPHRQEELYEPTQGHSLLGRIQSDILDYKEENLASPRPVDARDDSLAIHSCHSPMREMEVLFDHILRFMEEDPSLEPQDILVMAPNMDTYAPFVEAVFSASAQDGTFLPYNVAHKEVRTTSPGINAFLEILDLCRGRFESVAVLDAIGLPPIAQQFQFSESELETLARWVSQAHICWGADEPSKEALKLPTIGDNTWKSGLDRLLLGYAMSGDHEDFFQGISPFDDLAIEDAPLLGRFSGFLSALFNLGNKTGREHSLAIWAEIFEEICQTFIDPDTEDLGFLRIGLSKLSKGETEHAFSTPVSLAVARAALMSLLEKSMPSAGIFRRGINFCSISQGAGIPARVIFLVGMDDGAFPRQEGSLGFDHIYRFPRPGDRSPRGDDRFAFLLAILNAQTRLHISYVGQGIQDNAPMCPSPLVSELIDYTEAGFEWQKESSPLITTHKLQPFNPDYFTGTRPELYSYSSQLCNAAKALRNDEKASRPFFDTPLIIPEDMDRKVDLDTLCRFYRMPSRFILQERLGIILDEKTQVLETSEAFELGGLERYGMAGLMVEKTVQGGLPGDLFPIARARGQLPHGNVGDLAFTRLAEQIQPFAVETATLLASADKRLDDELEINGIQVRGRLAPIAPEGLFLYRTARIKVYDRLHAWILHLFLCMAQPEAEYKTMVAGTDGVMHFAWIPPEEARSYFAILLNIFFQGLEVPVPFFPETSFAYAQAMIKADNVPKALSAARSQWEPGYYHDGESSLSHNMLCFEGPPPLGEDFRSMAMDVFEPMIQFQENGGW